jgi:aminoglycoside phosphotransferase (APT) family kinase protein
VSPPERAFDHTEGSPLGLCPAALDAWLVSHLPVAKPPLEYRLVSGGRSNLTYELVDATGRRFILRRPPIGAVLESAHDVIREHRIITALSGVIPVPRPLAHCPDPAIIGAPFYIMEFIDGAIVRSEEAALDALDERARGRVGPSMAAVLGELHNVNPHDVGLGSLGREDAYVARQLRRWHSQFNDSRRRDVPVIDEVHRRLAARIPPQQRVSIVHGDFRIDNCVLGPDGGVRAVLDWELCTLGDPLADLGMLMVFWADPGDNGPPIPTGTPTACPGFSTKEELICDYAAKTALDLSGLDVYRALGYWKLACIFEGIPARYSAGVMADADFDAAKVPDQVLMLAEAALTLTEGL